MILLMCMGKGSVKGFRNLLLKILNWLLPGQGPNVVVTKVKLSHPSVDFVTCLRHLSTSDSVWRSNLL